MNAEGIDSVKRLLITIGACGLSAVAFWYGSGLDPIWWCAWIAPLPVFLWCTRLGAFWAFAFAMAASFIGALNEWHYIHTLIGLPALVVVAILAPPSLIFALATLLWRWMVLRGAFIRAAVIFPATIVAYYFVQQLLSVHATFGNPGYSQMQFLPILQIASLTGIAGVAFAQFFLPAALAAAAIGKGRVRHRMLTAAGAVAGIAAICLWGGLRLSESPGQTLEVGLVAVDLDNIPRLRGPEARLALVTLYAERAVDLIERGARLVILPEKIMRVSDQELAGIEAPIRRAAEKGAVVVFGIERWSTDRKFNEARVYSPVGGRISTYEKHHMLPPFESDLEVGTTRLVIDQPATKWGLQICKDMDFPQLSREYGSDRVGMMIVPAWDFDADGWLHGRMAIMRGVESGFSVARAANDGRLTLSDNRGRVLADAVTQNSVATTVLASLPMHHDSTLYARWGDWFSWLSIFMLAATALSAVGGRRTGNENQETRNT